MNILKALLCLFITSSLFAWEKPYNLNKQDDKDKQRWKLNETIQDIYNNLEDLAFRVNNTTYAYIYTHYYSTTSQHELLTNLTYATAGHSGFQADLSTTTWTAYRASTSTYSTDAGNLGMHPPIFFLMPENMIAGVFIDAVRISTASIIASGTADSTTYLRGDGSWSTPPGTGGGSSQYYYFDADTYFYFDNAKTVYLYINSHLVDQWTYADAANYVIYNSTNVSYGGERLIYQ